MKIQTNQAPESTNNLVVKAIIDKDIINTENWKRGKNNNRKAAKKIIDELWSDNKTEQLKKLIKNSENIVLITVPSTTRKNLIPIMLAQKISKELNIVAIKGEHYFRVLQKQAIKKVSRFDRIFQDRKYKLKRELDKNIKFKKAIIIDDVITTGGSIKAFAATLQNNKIITSNAVALMGDKRLKIDEKTKEKLKNKLIERKINIHQDKLANMLTRTEAGMVIQKLNQKGLKDERLREFTKNLQGLVNQLSNKNNRRNRLTRWNESTGRAHNNNGQNAGRIQNRSLRRSGRGIGD